MRIRKFAAAASLTVAALLVAACAGEATSAQVGQGDDSRTADPAAALTVANFAPPTVMDPHLSRNQLADPAYLTMVYDQLLRLDENLEIQPMLATSWSMAPDGLSLTLDLRQDVKFQDGSSFDASTVVANFDRAKNLPGSAAAGLVKDVTSVTAEGPGRVTITFGRPSQTFPYVLASNFSLSMISPEAIAEGRSLEREPAGSGPYRLVELGQDRATYEPAEYYWDNEHAAAAGRVTVIGILDGNARLSALQSGQIQASTFTVNQASDYRSQVESGSLREVRMSDQVVGLQLNTKTPGLDDPRVRKALSHAIDRNAINDALFDGAAAPAHQFYPESMDGYVEELNEDSYDPEQAKRLLEESGHQDLVIDVLVPGVEPWDSIGTVVQAQLAEVGVKMNIEKRAATAVRPAWQAGEVDGYVSAMIVGGDPSQYVVDAVFGLNNPGGAPANVAEVAQKALDTALDDPARPAAFERVSELLAEEPLQIYTVRLPNVYLADPTVMNLDEMSFSNIANLVDPRPLAVAETGQ